MPSPQFKDALASISIFRGRCLKRALLGGAVISINIVALSFPKGKDDEIIEWATERYGKQYVVIDNSMSSSTSQTTYSKKMQWDFEGTIVEFSLLAWESSDKKYRPVALALRYGSKENIEKIKPYIYISCSQKLYDGGM